MRDKHHCCRVWGGGGQKGGEGEQREGEGTREVKEGRECKGGKEREERWEEMLKRRKVLHRVCSKALRGHCI